MTNRIETMVEAASRPGGQGPKGRVDLARPLRCAVGQSPLRRFSLPCASRNGPNPRQRGQRDFFNGLLRAGVCFRVFSLFTEDFFIDIRGRIGY